MMNWKLTSGLIATIMLGAPSVTSPARATAFAFVCPLGSKVVRVSTEGKHLVYRYGTGTSTELTIRGGKKENNLFFRHDSVGPKGEGQQLRFVAGTHSYVLSSLFIAGADGADEVRFFVLRDGRIIRRQLCQGASSFEDYDQLDALPRDSMKPLNYYVS